MPSLPDVLVPSDLPLAELYAARLAGEVYPLSEAFCPLDTCDSRELRAAVLGAIAPARFIADLRTAAWLWGATAAPPRRHEFCIDVGRRKRQNAHTRFHLREVRIDADEIVSIGGTLVTTPLRTILDIGRHESVPDDEAVSLIAGLVVACGLDAPDCIAYADARRSLSYSVGARRRIDAALAVVDAVDVVDGVDAPNGVEHAVEVRRIAHLEHEATEREPVA